MLEPEIPITDYSLGTIPAPVLTDRPSESALPGLAGAIASPRVIAGTSAADDGRPSVSAWPQPWRTLSILGVRVFDTTRANALSVLSDALRGSSNSPRLTFFVNTHTLNLAAGDTEYRRVLNRADYVFGDGTGVRWAARLQWVRVFDNLCGTDLIPQLLQLNAYGGHRVFLLGGRSELIEAAARRVAADYPGWQVVGWWHGYLDSASSLRAVDAINDAAPHLLLVGMGNPRQEQWLDEHRSLLRVPLCAAVGGLFHYWAGDLRRAPIWLRRLGAEWLGILVQQPHKAKRYLLGNPLFLFRIGRQWLAEQFVRAKPIDQ